MVIPEAVGPDLERRARWPATRAVDIDTCPESSDPCFGASNQQPNALTTPVAHLILTVEIL